MQFILKKVHGWQTKDGRAHQHVSYFKGTLKLGGKVLAVEMSDEAGAKRFETRGGAKIARKKYFSNIERVTIEPVEEPAGV